MRDAKEIPLAHRGLAAFADPVAEPIAPVLDTYRRACRAGFEAMAEKLGLAEELRELEGDDGVDAGRVLVSLHRRREIHLRLAELERVISEVGENERTAVEIAEAHRLSPMFAATTLTASSTARARLEALIALDEAKLDEPLPASYTARLRRRRGG